ncbi:Bifunctional dTDP-4-dehydrorhamnose 3,5-epimerase/dTDP-4-dehydrorhamnose reductase, variant 3 [Balamuthia mandrillaris]
MQAAEKRSASSGEGDGVGGGFLVFGQSGWIGSQVIKLLKDAGEVVHAASSRLEDRAAILSELDCMKPKYVVNAAGVVPFLVALLTQNKTVFVYTRSIYSDQTGRPNVDWCEDHRPETIRANVLGTINLADCCYLRGIHLTNFASGCIYQYDEQHPIGGPGFKETDTPNYSDSFYSTTKIITEQMLVNYSNVLILRLRMPVSDDLHPRSFLTKITRYERVVNVPNSISILADLLPIALDLTKKERKGVYNFTNPGAISHNEILQMYKEVPFLPL